MDKSFEYIVLGAGAMGSAAAYHLAKSGKSVGLLEQFEVGHERGSSHGDSRITRYSYDNPVYVRMAKDVYPLWFDLERESGEKLFTKTGGLDIDFYGSQEIEKCKEALHTEGIPFESLDIKELRRRFPQFNLTNDRIGIYQADTGILNSSLCVITMARIAQKYGAQLFERSPATNICEDSDGVIVETERTRFKCKKVIITAGAWLPEILSKLGLNLPLRVSLEQYAFIETKEPSLFAVGRFPVFIDLGGGTIGWYGFPQYNDLGVKTAFHQSGPITTASERSFEPDSDSLDRLRQKTASLLPDVAGKVALATTCLYTNSADNHFVIDQMGADRRIVFAGGCSGHAFKFSNLIGQLVARMALNQDLPPYAAYFSVSRFNHC